MIGKPELELCSLSNEAPDQRAAMNPDSTVEDTPQLVTMPAPVQLPAELLRKRPRLFCLRIGIASAIIAATSTCMMSGSVLLFALGAAVQGAMYVHLIELQHSILHRQVFESSKINRILGFLLGLPMLISYSDFQYKHLKHHKYLGTMRNTETFVYQRQELNSIEGFVKSMLDYSRLITVAKRISASF